MNSGFSKWEVTWLPLTSALRNTDKPKFETLSTFSGVSKTDFRSAWPFRLPVNSSERKNQIGGVTVINSNNPSDLSRAHRDNPFLPNPYGQVYFESLLEAEWILRLDRRDDIRWITAQPLSIRAHDATGKLCRHVPDLLTVDQDGAVELLDAKPAERLQSPRALEAAAISEWLCEHVGWSYRTVSELGRAERSTFRYLRRARHARFEQSQLDKILHEAKFLHTQNSTLHDLSERCGGWSTAIAPILHLVWTGPLSIDESQPLSEFTQVAVTDLVSP